MYATATMTRISNSFLDYYTSLDIILTLFLIAIFILVLIDQHHPRRFKIYSYHVLVSLFLYNLFDWLSVYLIDSPTNTDRLFHFIKAFEYICGVGIGYFIALYLRPGKKNWLLHGLFGLNIIYELASVYTGWNLSIGPNKAIKHGPYHFVITLIWVIILIVIADSFNKFSKGISKKQKYFTYYIGCVVYLGVILQDLSNGIIHTSCISITIGYIIILLLFQNNSLTNSDITITKQEHMITTDALTGLLSRYAYEEELKLFSDSIVDKQIVAYSLDLNGLKKANDTEGHQEGDLLIQDAAKIIQQSFPTSKCYRTGGDEYAIVVYGTKEHGQKRLAVLNKNLEAFNAKSSLQVSFSVGMAHSSELKSGGLRELMALADQRMYQEKRKYYMDPRHDRRKNR
ncbi:GGDEF domain-containing protein [Lactobacillus sp.]|uniref:GGDEF domain-containing protein n=1 Tax=Lactobacillus sp. TaxID=1591 RepID=UPI003EF36AB0